MYSRICISKKATFVFVICICVFGFLLNISTQVASNPTSTRTNASEKKNDLKIIGGTPVEKGEFPYVLYLKPEFKIGLYFYSLKCTSVLIDPSWVLTAAHCLQWLENDKVINSSRVKVNINIIDLTLPFAADQEFSASEYFNFKPNGYNKLLDAGIDLALIKLQTPINGVTTPLLPFPSRKVSINNDYKKHVGPIERFKLIPNEVATVIGYGCSKPDNYPTHLPISKNMLIDKNILQKIELPIANITNNYTYVGFPINDIRNYSFNACYGDSGGPMIIQKDNRTYLTGILSRSGSGELPKPIYSTNLITYISWIDKTMRENSNCFFQDELVFAENNESIRLSTNVMYYRKNGCVIDVSTGLPTGYMCKNGIENAIPVPPNSTECR